MKLSLPLLKYKRQLNYCFYSAGATKPACHEPFHDIR